MTYKPIIDEFCKMFPKPILPNGERIKVLCPGTFYIILNQ